MTYGMYILRSTESANYPTAYTQINRRERMTI
jgi:hypothetical protein